MSKPVKTSSTTTTAKKRVRRDSLGVTSKSNFVGRRATFVEADFLENDATVVPGSLNTVTRTRLRASRADYVAGGPTVFFKAHGGGAQSQNAVASTRMARLLGMEKIIAHNAFGHTSTEKGVFSGTVPGVQLRTLAHDTPFTYPDAKGTQKEIDDYVKYSGGQVVDKGGQLFQLSGFVYQDVNFTDPAIQKGMADLQLFDAIAGQKDRHGGNIFIDPEKGTVTGIDDDQAFGAGPTPADLDKPWDKYVGLPALVDRRTAERIIALDPNRVRTELAPREGDLTKLTTKDIADAQQRLEAVQAHLRQLRDGGQLIDIWGAGTYRAAMAQPDKSYLGREATMVANAHAGGTFGGIPLQLAPPPPQPGQPLPGQPLPGQPLPGQPLPGQPLPGQPLQLVPTQPMPPVPALPTITSTATAARRPPGTPGLVSPARQRPAQRPPQTGPSGVPARPAVVLGSSRMQTTTTTTTSVTPQRAARIRIAANREGARQRVAPPPRNVPTEREKRVRTLSALRQNLLEQVPTDDRDEQVDVLDVLLRELGWTETESASEDDDGSEEKGRSEEKDPSDDEDPVEPDDDPSDSE